MLACEERDNHQLDKELLTNRLRHLEQELEASKNSVSEKTRESRILEVKHTSALQADDGGSEQNLRLLANVSITTVAAIFCHSVVKPLMAVNVSHRMRPKKVVQHLKKVLSKYKSMNCFYCKKLIHYRNLLLLTWYI